MKTTITFYYFNLLEGQECVDGYNAIKEKMKKEGRRKIYFPSDQHLSCGKEPFKYGTRQEEVELETGHFFDDQWNGNCPTLPNARIFDWFENYVPNWPGKVSQVRSGYYLELTPEIIELRTNTFKCGYCGKTTKDFGDGFCHHCLGGDYIEEETIYGGLTALRNFVKRGYKRGKFGQNGADLEKYLEEFRTKQHEKKIAATKKALYETEKELKHEIGSKQKLLEELKKLEGTDIIVGRIYLYEDTILFRNQVPGRKFTKEEAEKINERILATGFDYPFNVEFDGGKI